MLTSYPGIKINRIESINYNPSIKPENQSGRFWVVGEKNVVSISYSKPNEDFIHIFYENNEFVTVPANQFHVFAKPDSHDEELMTSFNTQRNAGI